MAGLADSLRNFAQSASNSIASNVSAPVDGIAWGLRKLGVPVPPKPLGGSDWMTEKGLTPPVKPGLAQLLGEFAGLAGPMVAAGKAPQIAGGLLKMGDNLAAPASMNTQAGKVFVYPQDKALATAQLNAAKSIDEGGLGLLANNTPAQRAQAMGFTDDAYHGTPNDGISRSRQFKDSMLGKSTQVNDARKGHFTTDQGAAASEYIWANGGTDGGNVLPLMLGGNRAKVNLPGEWMPGKYDGALDAAKAGGFDGLDIAGTTTLGKAGNYQVNFDPKNIRSRFAAFDPARRNEADILGRADPELLKLIAGGALGYGGYKASKD